MGLFTTLNWLIKMPNSGKKPHVPALFATKYHLKIGRRTVRVPVASGPLVQVRKEISVMKFSTIAVAAALFAVPAAAFAEGDPEKGEKVFKKCKACHVVDSEKRKIGPSLKGVIGAKAGAKEGFKYSKAMMKAAEEGLIWDESNIDKYLASPKKFLPKNKMAFAGLKKEKQRADVIAYLKKFSTAE